MTLYNQRNSVEEFLNYVLRKEYKATENEKRIMAYLLYNNLENSYIRISDIIEEMRHKGWFSVPYQKILNILLSKGGLLQ
jgi:hypothetical protein